MTFLPQKVEEVVFAMTLNLILSQFWEGSSLNNYYFSIVHVEINDIDYFFFEETYFFFFNDGTINQYLRLYM